MKTQYSRRPNHIFSSRGFMMVAGLLVLMLLVLGVRYVFPSAFFTLTHPLFGFGNYVSGEMGVFENAADIRRERDRLIEENRTLKNENEALSMRLAENEKFSNTEERPAVRVLARPPVTPYDVLVLDAGSTKGLYAGALVYAEGVPIGTIADVSQRSARALLFSAVGNTGEGFAGSERLPITIVGEGAGAFSSEVPREMPVVSGDMVYIPPGASTLGVIVEVKESPTSPHKALIIRPLVNPFTLTAVSIAL